MTTRLIHSNTLQQSGFILLLTFFLKFPTMAEAQTQCPSIHETALIQPPSPINFQQFGWSVSAYEGVSVVGAIEDFSEGTGAAYVYRENATGTGWDHEATMTPTLSGLPDGAANDQFGYAVANNNLWAVVGSPFHDVDPVNDDNTGAVYVFQFDGVIWSAQSKLTAIIKMIFHHGDTEHTEEY